MSEVPEREAHYRPEHVNIPNPNIIITLANTALPWMTIVTGDIEKHQAYVHDAGLNGLEIIPVQPSRLIRHLVSAGRQVEKDDEMFYEGSAQDATFDQVRTPYSWTPDKLAMNGLVKGLSSTRRDITGDYAPQDWFYPRWPKSMAQLRYIHNAVGSGTTPPERMRNNGLTAVLPAVFQFGRVRFHQMASPYGLSEGLQNTYAPFKKVAVEPELSVWKAWDLTEQSDPLKVRGTMDWHGFDTITLDVQRAQSFKDPEAMTEKLAAAGLVHGIHLRLGDESAVDLDWSRAENTKRANRLFIDSDPNHIAGTPEGRMLSAILYYWKRDPQYRNDQPKNITIIRPPRRDLQEALEQDQATIQNIQAMILAS
jgi:hypothetical protein